jgi:hypothetical protein
VADATQKICTAGAGAHRLREVHLGLGVVDIRGLGPEVVDEHHQGREVDIRGTPPGPGRTGYNPQWWAAATPAAAIL